MIDIRVALRAKLLAMQRLQGYMWSRCYTFIMNKNSWHLKYVRKSFMI